MLGKTFGDVGGRHLEMLWKTGTLGKTLKAIREDIKEDGDDIAEVRDDGEDIGDDMEDIGDDGDDIGEVREVGEDIGDDGDDTPAFPDLPNIVPVIPDVFPQPS